jgi:predicted RNase H-like nuclease (RuvC/YqgF family)
VQRVMMMMMMMMTITTTKTEEKKSSSSRLRTKFQIEALTVELSQLKRENERLKQTLERIQQAKQPKSNKHTADGGDVLLEEHLRELHLDKTSDVPQTVLLSEDRDELSLSGKSPGIKRFNYCKTKEEEELEFDYHQIFS